MDWKTSEAWIDARWELGVAFRIKGNCIELPKYIATKLLLSYSKKLLMGLFIQGKLCCYLTTKHLRWKRKYIRRKNDKYNKEKRKGEKVKDKEEKAYVRVKTSWLHHETLALISFKTLNSTWRQPQIW